MKTNILEEIKNSQLFQKLLSEVPEEQKQVVIKQLELSLSSTNVLVNFFEAADNEEVKKELYKELAKLYGTQST